MLSKRSRPREAAHLAVLLFDCASEGVDARLVQNVELAEPDLVRPLLVGLNLRECTLSPGGIARAEIHS